MKSRFQKLWRALSVVLAALLLLALFFRLYPPALRRVVLLFPLPGVVDFPPPGPTPPAPLIDAPTGQPPGGYVAFSAVSGDLDYACGFLVELEGGQRVGFSAAHAGPALPAGVGGQFLSPGGELMVTLMGQIGRGHTFYHTHLSQDYVVWAVADGMIDGRVLQPDSRGQAQPGERVLVYGRFENGQGGSRGWPAVVTGSSAEATWIQLEDSFFPGGFSGCPVVSRHTGRVVGMAVAGADRPPVVMGLHPIASLVEKAEAALKKH
jgi:hypothetical protein